MSGKKFRAISEWIIKKDVNFSSIDPNLTFSKRWFILCYLKWKGVDRDRILHLLGLNWKDDFSGHSWSVLWLVSLSQALLQLASEPFKWRISKVETDWHTHTHRHITSEIVELFTFAFKKGTMSILQRWVGIDENTFWVIFKDRFKEKTKKSTKFSFKMLFKFFKKNL